MINVYHCCVQKTGSQWFRKLFSDSRVQEISGLTPYNYEEHLPAKIDPRNLNDRFYDEAFPENTIVTPFYVSYSGFCSLPKPIEYKAFFIKRDPRDIVVSWYFSMKYSHGLTGPVAWIRELLEQLPLQEGLITAIGILKLYGAFDSMTSWHEASGTNKNIRLYKFEDLTSSNNFDTVKSLFDYCGIFLTDALILQLLDDYSFEKLSKRKQGDENIRSHYRKGIEGDWVHYFNDTISHVFNETVGNLSQQLGYKSWQETVSSELYQSQQKVSELSKKNFQIEEKLLSKSQKLEVIQSKITEVEGKISDLKSSTSYLTEEGATFTSQVESQVNNLNYALEILKGEVKSSTSEHRQKKNLQRIQRLRQKVSNSAKRQKKLESRLNNLENQIETLTLSPSSNLKGRWLNFKAKLKDFFLEKDFNSTFGHSKNSEPLNSENLIFSPLTESNRISLVRVMSVKKIVSAWLNSRQIDVSHELKKHNDIYLFECRDSQLRFFMPLDIAGSESFYRELEKIDWYYMPRKWEHDVALTDLKEAKTVLEVGAGRGDFVKRLRQDFGIDAIGIELNESAVQLGNENGIPLLRIDIEKFAEEKADFFDAVCTFQVLEHVPNPKVFLSSLIKVLKPGGKLIVAVPNADSFQKYSEMNLFDQPPHHMTQWRSSTFRYLEKLYPLRLKRIRFEPLADYHVDWYTAIQAKRFSKELLLGGFKSKVLHHQINPLLKKYPLVRRIFKGHTLYVCFEKVDARPLV
ncbi:MAG: methyltransferase domain-containing protein [Elainellaceae cyanobacterium]